MTLAIFKQVQNETSQGYELRKPLIQKISKYFDDRLVVSYYTRFGSNAVIDDGDAQMLTNMLSSIPKAKSNKIILIISSPGGDPLASEKIIKILSEYSDNDYWALVPNVAKSAATMICLGSSKVILGSVSELGPIDLQIVKGERIIPAYAIITAYDKLIEKGINLTGDQRIEPILQQLQDFSPSEIEYFRQVNNLSSAIAVKVLKNGMLKKLSEKRIEELIKLFLDPGESKVHGRPIFHSDIKAIDKNNNFKLELIGNTDDVWKSITEYHMRLTSHLTVTNTLKILECEEGSYKAS